MRLQISGVITASHPDKLGELEGWLEGWLEARDKPEGQGLRSCSLHSLETLTRELRDILGAQTMDYLFIKLPNWRALAQSEVFYYWCILLCFTTAVESSVVLEILLLL